MSVIVEVLQRVDTEDAAQAVMLVRVLPRTPFTDILRFRFHFDSLAHDNSAGSQKILNVALPNELETTSPPETPPPIILHGEQIVQKFNRTTLDRVCMFVALYRIKAKQVDLVLTANIPTTLTESLQSDEATFQRLSKKKFDRAVESLKVLDFELFV